MSEEVAQGLDRARKLIVERGWWQHGTVGPNGEICALEALKLAVVPYCYATYWPLWSAIVRAIGRPDIGFWNDAPERTRRQVLLAFRRAAKAERAKP